MSRHLRLIAGAFLVNLAIPGIAADAPSWPDALCSNGLPASHGVPETLGAWAEGAQLFDGLGDFHRPATTGSAEAQRYFDQGMRLLWAFNHDESTRSFAKAAALYASALSQYQAAYYRPGIAATHEEWADLLLAQQDWAGARDHLRRALSVRLWMYDSSRSMRVLDKLASADKALGDDAAVKQDGELSQYLKDGGDPSQSPAKPSASH